VYVCVVVELLSLALADTPSLRRCVRELVLSAADFLRFFGDLMAAGAGVARHLLGVVEGGGFAERVTGWLLIFGAVCSAYSAVLLCELLMMYGFVNLSKWARFVTVCSAVPMEGFEVCAR
jgi:hypothetical protein